MQNQHTRELIKKVHKLHQRMYLWWGLCTLYLHEPLVEFMYLVFTCTSDGVYVPCICMYLWWSLCTLYLHVPLVEFMYVVFTCTSGGVYIPCIYMHAR